MPSARFSPSRRRVLAAIAAGGVAIARPRRAGSQQLVTLRTSSSPDDDVTPLVYAQQTGIFARAGLDVRFDAATSGSAVAAAVAGGALEIGKSSMISLITAHVRGLLFDIISGGGMYLAEKPFFGLVVAQNSPIRSGADLNGKVAGCYSLKDLSQLVTMAWVDRNGGDASTMKFVEFPPQATTEAIVQGRIEAASLANPVLADAISSGRVRLLGRSGDAVGRRWCISAWFCNHTYALANAGVVKRFGEALRTAATYTNAHPAETVPMLASLTKIPPETIARMNRSVTATTLDPGDYQPLIDLAAKYKIIAGGFSAVDLFAAR